MRELSDIATAGDQATYFIAQYLRDPMRREARNIGLVIIAGDRWHARFVGEKEETSELDGRQVKWCAYPNIYRKWIRYWRQELRRGPEDIEIRLTKNNGGNYDLLPAGAVTDTGSDSIQTVCENLFRLLVEQPASEVVDEEYVEVAIDGSQESTDKLVHSLVRNEFKRLQILSTNNNIPHPILADTYVVGSTSSYKPAFYQHNGKDYIMEPLALNARQKKMTRLHSGYTAKMFDDIRALKHDRMEGIAIIHASSSDLKDKDVQYAYDQLKGSGRIVNWLSDVERGEFLSERERIARSFDG